MDNTAVPLVVVDLRMVLLRLERQGLTVEQIVDRCLVLGVSVTEDCLSRIRRGITKNPRYVLGKALERIATDLEVL